ncbi:MAG: chloride channel protein [Bacteroidota bacterium]|nr:chloride channel protein [Bacteroidota bacterium]
MNITTLLNKFTIWRIKHIKQRQFIIFLSFIVGILSGLAAILLKNSIYYTSHFLTNNLGNHLHNYRYLIFPIIGVIITVLFIKIFVKDNIGHGVSRILFAISKKNSKIKHHNNFSSIIASTLTIAFGGSVGSEAPIVLTGASIGSNIGRFFQLNYKSITLLLGCGASGAIAGIFNAPITGIIFTIEILMIDLTMASLVPLLISAVTAASVAYLFMGNGFLLSCNIHAFILQQIPYYIILGVITGFISLYFTRTTMRIESIFEKISNPVKRIIIGGLILGMLIYLLPSLYGEGYEVLQKILEGNVNELTSNITRFGISNNIWILLIYLSLILFLKVIAMSVTTGSGGIGGIFAPTLFIGGITGFIVSRIINITSNAGIPEDNFALVGMSGLMAGVMHAPLTGVFLIAEITGGYGLFIPLIITATISYITIIYFEPHSIYTKRLAKRGELFTHDKDRTVLSLMTVEKLIETNFITINKNAILGDLVKVISKSSRNIVPITDNENNLYGIVFINDIRHIMFKPELYEKIMVSELMYMPSPAVHPKESMEDVAKKFQSTEHYNLPVIEDGKYKGFVSRANVFSAYRKLLKEFSED